MSKHIHIQAPSAGLNTLLPANMIADRETPLAKNVLFVNGLIKTPHGFAKLAETGLPLNSGDAVIGITQYKEKDGTEHIVAVTTRKIYECDNVNSTWIDRSPADDILNSTTNNPVSFAAVPHTDAIKLDDDGADAFYHLLICDGGMSPIVRWAGKAEESFYPLAGADGYHATDASPATPTAHYAKQVNMFYNHVILISPKVWNATSDVFEDNPQAVLWGKVGLLEGSSAFAIAETGAGYNELVDTGDTNVWSKQLGSQLIIYQKHSIWSMSHVGGADVFRFRVEIPDLGLLAPHLLVSSGNQHYFIGNDFNIYQYSGGSYKQRIGDKIQSDLKDEIDFRLTDRCWMEIENNNSILWIFYVPEGKEYITKAYGVDLKTGSWMIREFSHVWTNSGITAVANIGAQSYMIGETYQQILNAATTYNQAISATTTYRQILQEVLTKEAMVMGDSEGNIYQYSAILTTDDETDIPSYFVSKVFDYGLPDTYKWWDGITVVAKGTKLVVSYRTSDFDTEDEGWSDFTAVDLTAGYDKYSFFFNETSTQIQLKFSDSDGSDFAIREFKIHAPTIEDEI